MVNVVEGDNLLIELEEMDLVRHHCLYLLLVLPINHTDTCLREVVGHSQLRIPVETNILLVVSLNLRVAGLVCLTSCTSWRVVLALLLTLVIKHLLEQKFVDLDIAVVHHKVFSHKVLQSLSIDNIKLRVALETIYHLVNTLLKFIPVLFVFLNLALGP